MLGFNQKNGKVKLFFNVPLIQTNGVAGGRTCSSGGSRDNGVFHRERTRTCLTLKVNGDLLVIPFRD